MRTVRYAALVTLVAMAACTSTQDSPGRGDTAVPYGGAGANGSVGSTPGYLNAAGADKNPDPNAATAAPAKPDTAAAVRDSAPAAAADTTK